MKAPLMSSGAVPRKRPLRVFLELLFVPKTLKSGRSGDEVRRGSGVTR